MKKFLALVLALCMVLSLTACGMGGRSSSSNSSGGSNRGGGSESTGTQQTQQQPQQQQTDPIPDIPAIPEQPKQEGKKTVVQEPSKAEKLHEAQGLILHKDNPNEYLAGSSTQTSGYNVGAVLAAMNYTNGINMSIVVPVNDVIQEKTTKLWSHFDIQIDYDRTYISEDGDMKVDLIAKNPYQKKYVFKSTRIFACGIDVSTFADFGGNVTLEPDADTTLTLTLHAESMPQGFFAPENVNTISIMFDLMNIDGSTSLANQQMLMKLQAGKSPFTIPCTPIATEESVSAYLCYATWDEETKAGSVVLLVNNAASKEVIFRPATNESLIVNEMVTTPCQVEFNIMPNTSALVRVPIMGMASNLKQVKSVIMQPCYNMLNSGKVYDDAPLGLWNLTFKSET